MDNDSYSIKVGRWVVGQTVLAKYKDSKFYEAVIESMPPIGATTGSYTVIFKGYTSKEKIALSDVRDFDPTLVAKPIAAVTGGAANKKQRGPTRALAVAFGNGEDRKSKKKRRNQEYLEKTKQIESEHGKKQNAWQKFASGSGKKVSLKTAPPLKKTSSKLFTERSYFSC